MTDPTMTLKILGARGSVPVHGDSFSVFGGGTTSFMIEAGDELIFIDAGSGIVSALPAEAAGKRVSLFITHPHLDHLLGLPFFKLLFEEGRHIDIYGVDRGGKDIHAQIDGMFTPPYWPCHIDVCNAEIEYRALSYRTISNQPLFKECEVVLGDTRVRGTEVPHPGGCTAFLLERGGKSIAVLTDAELPEPDDDPGGLVSFFKGTDIILCDSQYTEEEAAGRAGFGHTYFERAVRWMKAVGAGKLVLVHHDPRHDDEMLAETERRLNDPDVCLARSGDILSI